jgi:hypothetical protein
MFPSGEICILTWLAKLTTRFESDSLLFHSSTTCAFILCRQLRSFHDVLSKLVLQGILLSGRSAGLIRKASTSYSLDTITLRLSPSNCHEFPRFSRSFIPYLSYAVPSAIIYPSRSTIIPNTPPIFICLCLDLSPQCASCS